ncbi:MAG: GAF domain-containing protein, partial [Anaerolineae bacterium]|nr:GAF domain-containing protein [Anaerolineae bacterium]
SQSLDLEKTLETALDAVLQVIEMDSAGISLVDEVNGELVLRAQRGWRHDFVTQPMRIPLGEGMSGHVVREDEVLVTGAPADAKAHADAPPLAVPEFAAEGIQAMAMAPMHAGGCVVGVLSVMNHEPYQVTDDQVEVLRVIADQVGIAIENARLYENTKSHSSRLDAVLNSSGDAIIATDNHGHINLVNQTAEALFTLNRNTLLGLPLRNAPLHPKLREGLRRAMSNDASGNTVFEVNLEDGRFLSAIVSPVYAHQTIENPQQEEGWVLVVQDITHLRRAEQTRVNFIQAAAHDLRNPLGATMSALTMLQNEVTPEQREIVDLGVQGLIRMQDLIDSLLNLEHIESGVGLKRDPIDVHDLIERGLIDVQSQIQQTGQKLRIDMPPDLPTILGDMHWLHRALVNLLSNACKYTTAGDQITMRAYVHDQELYIEVEDSGPGIPIEAQTRLFERFYRVPEVKHKVKGTGLGLAIVKSVVEQHCGRVFVQSKPGQGSIFGMIFPVSEPCEHA